MADQIEVQVNAEPQRCPRGTSLADLLARLGYRSDQVAVAIDNEFVPRTRYAERRLKGAERIDVLMPIQGG